MKRLKYTPDEDIQVHEEGAIRLICAAFQSHETGLPEWLKNSADEYARSDALEDKRAIVVMIDHGRSGRSPSISCLDFSGMTSDVIEESFRVWADPEAARRGTSADVQGGHGNGGKCYMTQLFEEHALIHTVKGKEGCRYGVQGGSVRFGYIPHRASGRDFVVGDLDKELSTALAGVGVALASLPSGALLALEQADGFTLVTGRKPKGYGTRIPVSQLVDSIMDHPQMIRTLEMCSVYVMVDGTVLDRTNPLVLPPITPDADFADDRPIPIPEQLIDPESEEMVSTTAGRSLPQGELTLRTSDVSMRYSRKNRHTVVYRAQSGFIGYVPILALDVGSPYRDRIYGECALDALEPAKQNERARLANSPVTRAVEAFVSTQVESLAKEFEARDRKTYDNKARDELSKINEALDQWKNQFIDEILRGLWGPGTKIAPPPPPPLPSGIPARMELALTHGRAGIGVSFRPTLKFFDIEGRRIRSVPYRWTSDDTNVALVDEDLQVINTFSEGTTRLQAETLDGSLRSNAVPLEVARITEIFLQPEALDVGIGSRRSIDAICKLADGEGTRDVYLVWAESNPVCARVSASGQVFGFSIGETEVTAGDDHCLASPAMVRVVEGVGAGEGETRGPGYPKILVSNINKDPETDETVNFSPDDPPVAQRPQDVDRNIWWINSSAPFARMYLDSGIGYGYQSREWRIYHLERYIEIMVQIALTHDPDSESLGVGDWILRWGERVAEIQAAAAGALKDFIASGQLPEVSTSG